MRLMDSPGPGNPAEWWAVWVAIALGLVNLYYTWKTRRELHLPGWRVLLRSYQWHGPIYIDDSELHGNLRFDRTDVVDRGSEWVLENVGRGDASHVRVVTAFDRRTRLARRETMDLGHFPPRRTVQIAKGLEGAGWPSLEAYTREVARLDRWLFNRVRVEWVTPQGRTKHQRVRVQIADYSFRDDGPPQIDQRSDSEGRHSFLSSATREQLTARGVSAEEVEKAFRGEADR